MQGSTVKTAFLAAILATALPLWACGDGDTLDALLAELNGSFAQPRGRFLQVLRQILRQRRLRRRPAVVRLALLDPLFAVVTLVPRHT